MHQSRHSCVISNSMTKQQQLTSAVPLNSKSLTWGSNAFLSSLSLSPCSITWTLLPSFFARSNGQNSPRCNQVSLREDSQHCLQNLHLYDHTAAGHRYLCRRHAEHTVPHFQPASEINSGDLVRTTVLKIFLHQTPGGDEVGIMFFGVYRNEKLLLAVRKMFKLHIRK